MRVEEKPSAEAVNRFEAAGHEAGYSPGRIQQMRIAAARSQLPLEVATAWLEGGFTPWAAAAWSREFDTPGEAASYRTRGLSVEQAYQVRFDERQAAKRCAHPSSGSSGSPVGRPAPGADPRVGA